MKLERANFGLLDLKLAGSDADAGVFTGYGAVFNNTDSYNHIIQPGAFAKDLKRWKGLGKWPKMLLQHGGWGVGLDDMMPVGQWTDMVEDSKGLKVTGRLFAMNTERGQYVYEGLKSGELDSLSIGFEIVGAKEEVEDGDHRLLLTEIKLWEVSIVTFPANDQAKISSVKQLSPDQVRELEGLLGERGLSRTDRVKAVSAIKQFLQREAGGPISAPRDEGVPEASDTLAAANDLAAKFAAACLKF